MHQHTRQFAVAVFLASALLLGSPAFAGRQADPAGTNPPPGAQLAAAPAAPIPASAEAPPYAPPPSYPAPAYYPPPGYPPPGYPPPGYYPPPGAYYAPRPSGPPPGYHDHDGFYMRLCIGAAYLRASDSYGGQSETFSGSGLSMDFAFGGVVASNLSIFGEIAISSAIDPTYESGGTSMTLTNTNLNLVGFGPGVAYYLQPLNLYLSGSVLFSRVTADDSSSNSNNSTLDLTDTGFGMNFMAGKEWWVSANWGIGVATMLQFASMKMRDYDARMTATGISLLFSATYN